jgi:hypothetical protein
MKSNRHRIQCCSAHLYQVLEAIVFDAGLKGVQAGRRQLKGVHFVAARCRRKGEEAVACPHIWTESASQPGQRGQ